VKDGVVVPHYLTERDHVWLRALVDEYERFVGRPRRELDARLQEPLPCSGPPGKRRLAIYVLDRHFRCAARAAVPPVEARAGVFFRAALGGERSAVIREVASRLGIGAEALEDALFADLPGERRVAAPETPLSPAEVALRANLALVQGILHRSSGVRVELAGNARAVVRHAKLRGLICTIDPRGESGDVVLHISGPLAILRRTLLYGRALAGLVPILGWCTRFRLRALCTVRGEEATLVVSSGDPIFPSAPPRLYDSGIEKRFERDFRRAAPDWDVIREPEPVAAGGTLVFPDFLIRHRVDPRRRFLVEIAGFWTPEYLQAKLARLRAARLSNLVLCIDEDRCCGEAALFAGARIVRFRRRVDPGAVLRAIEGAESVTCGGSANWDRAAEMSDPGGIFTGEKFVSLVRGDA
jgi:predicted nuclease of restriction endonuclease-like RecB superfamily